MNAGASTGTDRGHGRQIRPGTWLTVLSKHQRHVQQRGCTTTLPSRMNAGAPTDFRSKILWPLSFIARPLPQPQTAKTNHKILRLRFPALVKTCGSPPALRITGRAQGTGDGGQRTAKRKRDILRLRSGRDRVTSRQQPQTAKTNHKILRLRFPALVKTCGSPPALRMALVGDSNNSRRL